MQHSVHITHCRVPQSAVGAGGDTRGDPKSCERARGSPGQGSSVTTAGWAQRARMCCWGWLCSSPDTAPWLCGTRLQPEVLFGNLPFFFCYMQPHFYHFCKGLYQNLLNFVGIDVKCPRRASCEGDDGEEGFLSPNAYKGFRPRVCTKGEPCSSSSFRL